MIIIQIFRPYKDHTQTARYLDDIRLNKQILEAWQISAICLSLLHIRNDKITWVNHPIVQNIYNHGNSYCPDLFRYIMACDSEWRRRGKNRSDEFRDKLISLRKDILLNRDKFCWLPMRPYFNNDIKDCDEVFEAYRNLLWSKWQKDKIVVKCSLGKIGG